MRRAVPTVVWLIAVVHLVVALAQTAVFPNARSPDERQQVDLVLQVAEGDAWPWPDPGTAFLTEGIEAGYFIAADSLSGPQHLADRDDLPPRGQRLSYDEAGGDSAPVITSAGEPVHNQLIQHPPLYYLLGGAVVAAVPGWADQPLDAVWMLLRWGNALLVAALPLLLFLTARRLGLADPLPVVAAATPLLVPELTHIESSVNNDTLLIVLFAAATYLVARVLTGDLRWTTGAALGAVTSLALLTKGFALLMPAWILLAYVVAAARERQRTPDAARGLLVAAAASVPGALWWLRNKLEYGTIQPHGTQTEPPDLTAVYGWSDGGWDWLSRFAERMVTLFFVNDHDADRAMDASWWMARVALVAVVAGIGVTLARRSLPRTVALVLLFPIPALAAIVARGSYEQFAAFGDVAAAQQGRYLFPGIVGLMVVAVAGAAALAPAHRRWVLPGLLALAVAIHAAFWHDVWTLYWLPADTGVGNLGGVTRAARAMVEWYPFPPAVLGVVLLAGSAAAVLLARHAVVAATEPVEPVRTREPVA
ncbi:glycosyltransferase family 39 protein [Jiangella mangrovi]|uniref:4-amino-4-deoxy-L-arabinose transferase-like glycosyltransferase n=1 Tax=Jiangella mangrovi TaxID=1524084 RepID=A0A7W9GLV4_9ACTN|nr:glycosyltransferase family 39 protein [Jiangella mangrovi]MBB5786144.1 4-amino-4-deoxy-L-arabinose transferase-like glycosyltransferase [Jiangella mangrovi]